MDAVEGIQTAMMEQVAVLVKRVDTLEAHNGKQCLHISELKQKVEQGEETLLKCAKASEMILSKACHCNKGVVMSGSGLREESLELKYTSEDKEFRMPPPELMTLVLEGGSSDQTQVCDCPLAHQLAGDSSLEEGSLLGSSYVEAPVENKEVSLHSCCA